MRKTYALILFLLVTTGAANAQSKVFKEVSEEISSSMQAIMQDGALVGYLMFTQLEKVNEDSFAYKLTIMDENLNDLGTVNFREERMGLEGVAFEQDILCVAYFKSNIVGKEFKNRKAYNEAAGDKKNEVMLQFLNLDGKIIKTNTIPVTVTTTGYSSIGSKIVASGSLKNDVQLRNIPQNGFACFFSDAFDNQLLLYNTKGERLWKKKLSDEAGYVMLTTQNEVYVLSNGKMNTDGRGYSLSSYGVADSADYISRYKLRDKEGRYLRVLGFSNDPQTGKPFIAGNIISDKKNKEYYTGKGLSKGPFAGLFKIDITGKSESDIKPSFTYWEDGSMEPSVTKKGKFIETDAYINYDRCIRDFKGNTYFVGSNIQKKVRWGAITASVLLSPLIIPSVFILGSAGTNKYKVKDAAILRMDPKGTLVFENNIDCNSSGFRHSREALISYDMKKFFPVSNSTTQTNYIVVDDTKDIVIYSVTQKKVARTISHKEGKSRFNIYPAKEGHIMVSEYNKKEKFTRLSIEAL